MTNVKCKKKLNFRSFFAFVINIGLIISSILLILNVLKLKGIENTIRYVVCGVYSLIIVIIMCFVACTLAVATVAAALSGRRCPPCRHLLFQSRLWP